MDFIVGIIKVADIKHHRATAIPITIAQQRQSDRSVGYKLIIIRSIGNVHMRAAYSLHGT